jgi:hypothetical protein
MFRKNSVVVFGFIGGILGTALNCTWPSPADAGGPTYPVSFGTGAFAVQETDSLEAITDAITGILSPLVPASLSQTLPSVSLPSIGTLAISASTTNTVFDSTSDAQANTITVLIGTPVADTITIGSATSETKAHCENGSPRLDLATSVASVTVNGTTVVVTGNPNQVVSLPNSGGEMVLNQQDDDELQASGFASANAANIHLSASDRDRIIAHTEGFASCY